MPVWFLSPTRGGWCCRLRWLAPGFRSFKKARGSAAVLPSLAKLAKGPHRAGAFITPANYPPEALWLVGGQTDELSGWGPRYESHLSQAQGD